MASGSLVPAPGVAGGDPVMTAAQMVLAVPPAEDSGVDVADRFEWQAAMAAADGLTLYLRSLDDRGNLRPDCDNRVLCEWQEDWVLLEGDDAQLCSGKHRDPSVSAYTTVRKLVDEGGLAHLFDRWSALGERPLCRLVTSGGIAAGDPQALVTASEHFLALRLARNIVVVHDDHRDIVDKVRKAMADYCDSAKARWAGGAGVLRIPEDTQRAEVARFLSMLSIDQGKPQRAYVEHAAPNMYAQPVLDRLGLAGTATVVWEAVTRVFRARMRAKGPVPTAALPAVMAFRPGSATPTHTDIERDLAARIVTMGDIDTAIRSALAMPSGYEPVPRVPLTTRLAVKMGHGGCSDNAVERAEHLRMDYQNYWRDRIGGEATARAEQRRFERRLLRIIDEATDTVAPADGMLWRRLQQRVDQLAEDSLPAGMDAELALGGLCELANQCKVWFGQRFDVDAEIARLRTERGES